jgi:DNA polymerase-3 subunit gamma/tau
VYDFNRISVEDTVAHLQNIAQKEGVEAELEALNIIAVKSDGGMRDALSTFDQVVSFCGKKITYKDVIDNLGVLDYDYYFTLTDLCLQQKMSDALLLFNDILNKGFDAGNFISGLLAHFRDLLVCKDETTAKLLEVGASIRSRYIEQAKQCPAEFLLDAMEEANQSELDYKQSKNKRLLVELMLIRLCQLTDQKKKVE